MSNDNSIGVQLIILVGALLFLWVLDIVTIWLSVYLHGALGYLWAAAILSVIQIVLRLAWQGVTK